MDTHRSDPADGNLSSPPCFLSIALKGRGKQTQGPCSRRRGTPLGCAHISSPSLATEPLDDGGCWLCLSPDTNTARPRPSPEWFFAISLWGRERRGRPVSVGLSLPRSRGTSCSGVAMAQPNICHNRRPWLAAGSGAVDGHGRPGWRGRKTEQDRSWTVTWETSSKPPPATPAGHMSMPVHRHGDERRHAAHTVSGRLPGPVHFP